MPCTIAKSKQEHRYFKTKNKVLNSENTEFINEFFNVTMFLKVNLT